ncbi:DUF7024 domain-containing protein [Psychromonas aquimarina]|uniref:DUF7024 domain-containing protein n=1 Tax=Psychromonas aquimarina TaxID=444919 RepID=UPI0006876174|nr:hypothetical protein [Psychromonas aquimarina]
MEIEMRTDFTPPTLKDIILKEYVVLLLGCIFVTLVACTLFQGIRDFLPFNLSIPYIYAGDGLGYSWQIKRIMEGWIFSNERSGFPFGSDFYDYPGVDAGNYLVIKFISLFFSEYPAVFNLYILMSFPAVFLSSYIVSRLFSLRCILAFSISVIFTFSAFHMLRIDHLFYIWYFCVPIFIYISYRIYSNESLMPSSVFGKIVTILMLMFISSFGVYYTLFGVIALFVSFILSVFKHSYKVKFVEYGLIIFVVITTVMVNLIPNIYHQSQYGSNPEVAERAKYESEVYGFKFMQLILPRPGHRIDLFARVNESYSSSTPLVNENMTSSLGILGSLGLLVIGFSLVIVLAGRPIDVRLSLLISLTLLFYLFGTIGGAGSLFAWVISASIRGWNRISIFISFTTILALFIVLQFYFDKSRWFFKSRLYTVCGGGAISLLTVLAILDQTTSANIKAIELQQQRFEYDNSFVKNIEAILPAKSSIYQLPYIQFPEAAPPYGLHTYDLATGFLHSQQLNWSYAGMKGREGDLFYRALSEAKLSYQIDVIRKLGFAGIYIDSRGFKDGGRKIISEITELLGEPRLVRKDNMAYFFKLSDSSVDTLTDLTTKEIIESLGYIGYRYEANLLSGFEFSNPGLPSFLRDISGLSQREDWGRWSDSQDGDFVHLSFIDVLPNKFQLVLKGVGFGPNIGELLKIKVGNLIHEVKIIAGTNIYHINFVQDNVKLNDIEIYIPTPVSPFELGLGNDHRQLGFGFVSLKIIEVK